MSDQKQPNIVFIMSDDHAAHSIGAYGSVVNETPQIDRIGREGVVLDNCFCTNSICAPSRATILTGTHSHINGVRTLDDPFDGRQETVQALLRDGGYQTAIVGKWHLGHGGHADPAGFDYWAILPGQGLYHNPDMYVMGQQTQFEGYATDIITDLSLDWLERRNRERPFALFLHHKAPHRNWQPDAAHEHMFDDVEIPYPATFDDDYANRSQAARDAKMRIDDLTGLDMKVDPPEGLSGDELKRWKYQRYIKDYLACVASVDDNVGRVLDYLDTEGIAEDTIIIYTSDQGFFLGDHGWFDKRFMYEESLRMPFLMRYPREIPAGTRVDAMVTNVDFAPAFLDYAGLPESERMQGRSFRRIVAGDAPSEDWQEAMYYRYWMHRDSEHNTTAHYGIRTKRHKLIYYYGDPLDAAGANGPATEPEWELFDLERDPAEMRSVYDDPAYAEVVRELTEQLHRLQAEAGDKAYETARQG
jgi:arylsulfatase A-like enzyme